MSRRDKKKHRKKRVPKAPAVDHRIHPEKTPKGRVYKFTDKHHHPEKGDHSCWLTSISRKVEFSMFKGAEDGDFCDEDGNLYNVHIDDDEYKKIGTRHELMAIFWNSHSVAEWHGHPIWPIKVKDQYNRKTENYRPPKMALDRMVEQNRVSRRDADRLLRGNDP